MENACIKTYQVSVHSLKIYWFSCMVSFCIFISNVRFITYSLLMSYIIIETKVMGLLFESILLEIFPETLWKWFGSFLLSKSLIYQKTTDRMYLYMLLHNSILSFQIKTQKILFWKMPWCFYLKKNILLPKNYTDVCSKIRSLLKTLYR